MCLDKEAEFYKGRKHSTFNYVLALQKNHMRKNTLILANKTKQNLLKTMFMFKVPVFLRFLKF